MNYEINQNNHKRVEENKKSIAFKALTKDDEKEKSENEDLDLITKKFMKSIKLEKIKEWRKSHSRKESSSSKKKKKALVAIWSESENDEDFIEEECTNENANMCFMALEEHEDEVNSNSNYNEFQDAFQELYFDLENLGLKNVSLKKKISNLQNELKELKEKFKNIEKTKISFERENKELKKKKE